MSTTRPYKITLRVYQVGFGDCFLLTFHYSEKDRSKDKHLLIDFGTTARPDTVPDKHDLMLEIAQHVQQTCKKGGGRLHAVVATHRHADHISGFALRKGKESSGKVIRDCKPQYVIRPWTENPRAARNATGSNGKTALHNGVSSFAESSFVAALSDMQEVAALMSEEMEKLPDEDKNKDKDKDRDKDKKKALYNIKSIGLRDSVVEQLRFMSFNNARSKDPANMAALNNLAEMGKNIYTFHGDKKAKRTLEQLLPGVEVYILGPPTLKQSRDILSQRARDDEQFWHLHGGTEAEDWKPEMKEQKFWELRARNKTKLWETAALDRAEFWQLRVADSSSFWKMQADAGRYGVAQSNPVASEFAVNASPQAAPAHARWFIRRMNSARSEQLLEIVRTLDRVLNNTSLILLFKVGDKKLLFPGDAQWENWAYALNHERNKKETKELLQGVTVYKVGHHGSLNATPKKLWNIIKPRKDDNGKEKLLSVLSTKSGKHGKIRDQTEVPRKPLVEELKTGEYFSTQQLKWGEEATENKIYKDIPIHPVYKREQSAHKASKRRTVARRKTQR